MPVVVVADHHFKPDALAGGLAQLVALLPETRALEGCLDIQVLQDQDDANHVVLIETWAHADGHTSYVAWRTGTETLAGLPTGSRRHQSSRI
jgi:quinol monooxygenase YgiN